MEIGIVLLNYLNWKDTVECIESLKNQTNQQFQIVIVDNNSGNESIPELYKRYGLTENIHILENSENLGFAKGNNTGIAYCRSKLNLYNVLVSNNDVIFTDKNYIDYLVKHNYSDNVGVVGTEIIGSDGKNQNPRYFNPSSKSVLREFFSPVLHSKMAYKMRNIRDVLKNKSSDLDSQEPKQQSLNKQKILHGSVLFFTENYLKIAKGFYPETFLYYEEEILALVIDKIGLQMEYDPSISIYHKEDQSSQLSFQNLESIKRGFARKSVRVGLKVSLTKTSKILKVINYKKYNTSLLQNETKVDLTLD